MLETLKQKRESLNQIDKELAAYYEFMKRVITNSDYSKTWPTIDETFELFGQAMKSLGLSKHEFKEKKRKEWQIYFDFFNYLYDSVEREFLFRFNELTRHYKNNLRSMEPTQQEKVERYLEEFEDEELVHKKLTRAVERHLDGFRAQFKSILASVKQNGQYFADKTQALIDQVRFYVDAYDIIQDSGVEGWNNIANAVKRHLKTTTWSWMRTVTKKQKTDQNGGDIRFIRSDIYEIGRYLNQVLLPQRMYNILMQELNLSDSLEGGSSISKDISKQDYSFNREIKRMHEPDIKEEQNKTIEPITVTSNVVTKAKQRKAIEQMFQKDLLVFQNNQYASTGTPKLKQTELSTESKGTAAPSNKELKALQTLLANTVQLALLTGLQTQSNIIS